MTSLRDLFESARTELPAPLWAKWGSVLFSLSVLSFLISLAAAQAMLAMAAVFYALHLVHHRPAVSFPPVKLPLALFCLTTVIPIGWAENPTVGWFAVRKLTLFVILLLGMNLVVSAKHLTVLYKGLFVESAVAGLVSVPQFLILYRRARALHPHQVYVYMTVERVRGFMGHWMNFGGQQMLVFSALLAFLLLAPPGLGIRGPKFDDAAPPPRPRNPKTETRVLWWFLLAIISLSLALNLTRGVWLGCFVATIYLVGCRRPRWLWALPVLIAVGLLLSPRLIRQRMASLRQPSLDPSISIRFEMLQVGLRMIRKHPWVGVGPNNIPEVYALYLPPGKAPQVGYRDHLHNNFIQLAAERGLPCLAAWIWLMVGLVWPCWSIRRRVGHFCWVVDAAIASWMAMVVEGTFEFSFGASPVLMVFLFIATTPFVVERWALREAT